MGFNRDYLPIHSTHEIGHDNVDFQTTITTSSIADAIILTQSGNDEVSQIVLNQSNVRELLAIMSDIASGCGFSTKLVKDKPANDNRRWWIRLAHFLIQ